MLLKSFLRIWKLATLTLALCFFALGSPAANSQTLFIGDIHGDPKALLEILANAQAITKDGKLTAQYQDIVFVGDLVGKGRHSIEVIDIVMSLQEQSKNTRVHVLAGNHELRLLNGELDRLSSEDLERLEKIGFSSANKAFGSGGIYGEWLSKLDVMIKVDNELISHAGFGRAELGMSVEQINVLGKEWLEFFYTQKYPPPRDSAWIVGLDDELREWQNSGPIWTSSMAPSKKKRKLTHEEGLKFFEVADFLKANRVNSAILGHNPTPEKEILFDHPEFGRKVILIDTGISQAIDGNLSALTKSNGKFTSHHWKRPHHYAPWIRSLRDSLFASLSGPSSRCRALRRRLGR